MQAGVFNFHVPAGTVGVLRVDVVWPEGLLASRGIE